MPLTVPLPLPTYYRIEAVSAEGTLQGKKAYSHKPKQSVDSAVKSCVLQKNIKFSISTLMQSTAESTNLCSGKEISSIRRKRTS